MCLDTRSTTIIGAAQFLANCFDLIRLPKILLGALFSNVATVIRAKRAGEAPFRTKQWNSTPLATDKLLFLGHGRNNSTSKFNATEQAALYAKAKKKHVLPMRRSSGLPTINHSTVVKTRCAIEACVNGINNRNFAEIPNSGTHS